MTKRIAQVKPYTNNKKEDKEAITLGKKILKGDSEAIVMYRKKKWLLHDLIQFLASRIYDLERKQCKPSAKCLFEGERYLEEKYIGESYDKSK